MYNICNFHVVLVTMSSISLLKIRLVCHPSDGGKRCVCVCFIQLQGGKLTRCEGHREKSSPNAAKGRNQPPSILYKAGSGFVPPVRLSDSKLSFFRILSHVMAVPSNVSYTLNGHHFSRPPPLKACIFPVGYLFSAGKVDLKRGI